MNARGDADAKRIQVVVRVRPRLPSDAPPEQDAFASECADARTLEVEVRSRARKDANVGGARQSNGAAKQFAFDACLDGDSSQAAVQAAVDMQGMVGAALAGYPVMLFAFGQTGSGKTHTIIGPETLQDQGRYQPGVDTPAEQAPDAAEAGLLSASIRAAFVQLEGASERTYEVSVTVLEVYNESISDLLGRRHNTVLRQDAAKGFYVQGLRRVVCRSAEHTEAVVAKALLHRCVAAPGSVCPRAHAC